MLFIFLQRPKQVGRTVRQTLCSSKLKFIGQKPQFYMRKIVFFIEKENYMLIQKKCAFFLPTRGRKLSCI